MSRKPSKGIDCGIDDEIVVISSGEEEQSGELVFTPTKQPPSECSRYVLYKRITWVVF